MLCGGSRASVHLWDHRHPPTLGLGFSGANVFGQSSFVLRPSPTRLQRRMKSSSRSHCKAPGQTPVPRDCLRFLHLAVVLIVYVFCFSRGWKSDFFM